MSIERPNERRARGEPWRTDPLPGFEGYELRLGEALSGARWSGALDPQRLGAVPPSRAHFWRAIGGALLAAAAWLACWLLLFRGDAETASSASARFVVRSVRGSVRVEGASARALEVGATLAPGDRLLVAEGANLVLTVGDIGFLELLPGAALRIDAPLDARAEGSYRVALELGAAEANVAAAPRVFQVGTPAGIAVDLGCKYRTTVREDGFTTLEVLSGAVSFEARGRKLHVPAGARLSSSPDAPPSTPHWNDASTLFLDSLRRLDASASGDPRDLEQLLAEATQRDSLTLWNLLDHPDASVRRALFEALAEIEEPPSGVTLEAILAGELAARERWRDEVFRPLW
ncbi:MAG: hypothetical protein IPN34_00515 [Planctomycetes bacterium]|nr:hypothetical protein [Planctomycetota bacterium]